MPSTDEKLSARRQPMDSRPELVHGKPNYSQDVPNGVPGVESMFQQILAMVQKSVEYPMDRGSLRCT
jgi:hypothetical protein